MAASLPAVSRLMPQSGEWREPRLREFSNLVRQLSLMGKRQRESVGEALHDKCTLLLERAL
jgi:hypothetical protein